MIFYRIISGETFKLLCTCLHVTLKSHQFQSDLNSFFLPFITKQSKTDPMSADSFLDRYSLPRIARLIAPKSLHDDQQQKQQNSILGKSKKLSTVNHYLHQHPINSTSTTTAVNNNNSISIDTNNSDDIKADNSNNGELFLLYRHLKKYKVYHAVNAKSGTNRKKGIKIPQDFTGECVVDIKSNFVT
jgi:hypothetical protein